MDRVSNVVVDSHDLFNAVKLGSSKSIFYLKSAGNKALDNIPVLIKEVQKDVVTEELLHIDFHRVNMKKEVTVQVPFDFIGKAEGIKTGGVVEPILREITVKCLPTNIPQSIEVDITALNIGDSIHLSTIKAPSGTIFLFDLDETVITVAAPKVEAVPEPVAETEEGAKEEENGKNGDAAAAGDDKKTEKKDK